jgi:hypothetical protein
VFGIYFIIALPLNDGHLTAYVVMLAHELYQFGVAIQHEGVPSIPPLFSSRRGLCTTSQCAAICLGEHLTGLDPVRYQSSVDLDTKRNQESGSQETQF